MRVVQSTRRVHTTECERKCILERKKMVRNGANKFYSSSEGALSESLLPWCFDNDLFMLPTKVFKAVSCKHLTNVCHVTGFFLFLVATASGSQLYGEDEYGEKTHITRKGTKFTQSRPYAETKRVHAVDCVSLVSYTKLSNLNPTNHIIDYVLSCT